MWFLSIWLLFPFLLQHLALSHLIVLSYYGFDIHPGSWSRHLFSYSSCWVQLKILDFSTKETSEDVQKWGRGGLARDLRIQKQHSDESSGISFSRYVPNLELKKVETLKHQQVQTKKIPTEGCSLQPQTWEGAILPVENCQTISLPPAKLQRKNCGYPWQPLGRTEWRTHHCQVITRWPNAPARWGPERLPGESGCSSSLSGEQGQPTPSPGCEWRPHGEQ